MLEVILIWWIEEQTKGIGWVEGEEAALSMYCSVARHDDRCSRLVKWKWTRETHGGCH